MSTLPPSQPYDEFGIVAGTAVMGANIVLDVFAGITDVVGGRSGKYQAVLETGRETALAEMCEEAQ